MPSAPRRAPWLPLLACALLLAHALAFRFVIDDAYISFRYARNLLDGHGLVFNPGDPVEGYSNLSWVLLAAVGMAAGLDPLLWARLLGFAAAAGTTLLLPGLAGRLAGRDGSAPAWPALLLAACGPVACWSLAGLETPLFGLLLVLGLRAALDRRPFAAGGVGVLLALTRPEGVAFGAACAAWAALPPDPGAAATARGGPRWSGAAVLAAGVAAHLLWRHATYGQWLPNTWYAKTGDFAGQLRTGLPYAGSAALWWLLPWAAVAGWLASRGRLAAARRADWRRAALLIAGWTAYCGLIGGDMLGMHRFFAPVLPVVVAAGAAMLTAPEPAAPARRGGAAGGAPTALAAVVVLLAAVSLVPSFAGRERRLVRLHMSLENLGGWRLAAEGLARQLPPGSTIALMPVGYIPYRTGFVTYDILGLTDRHIAHRRMSFTQGYAGHEKHDGAYILSRRPEYLLLGNVDVTDQPRRGPMRPFDRELDIFRDPVFQTEYVPVFLPLPGGKYLNFFKRADAP